MAEITLTFSVERHGYNVWIDTDRLTLSFCCPSSGKICFARVDCLANTAKCEVAFPDNANKKLQHHWSMGEQQKTTLAEILKDLDELASADGLGIQGYIKYTISDDDLYAPCRAILNAVGLREVDLQN